MTILEIDNDKTPDEPEDAIDLSAVDNGPVKRRRYIFNAKLHKKAYKKRGKRRQKSKSVTPKKQRKVYFPLRLTFTEHYSRPFSDLMKSWAALAFKDAPDSETPVLP